MLVQDPPISSDDSEETVSDPPRSSRSRSAAAPKVSTVTRAKARVSPRGTSAAEEAVIVIEDSPPSTQQPASLALEARQPATTALAAIISAESAQTAVAQGPALRQQPLHSKLDQSKDDRSQLQHHTAPAALPEDGAQPGGINNVGAAELVAEADPPEAAQRDEHHTAAAAVDDDASQRNAETSAAPLGEVAVEALGSVYVSPNSSLPEQGEIATPHLRQRDCEPAMEKPASCIAAERGKSTSNDGATRRDEQKQQDASLPGEGTRAIGDCSGGDAPFKSSRLPANPIGAGESLNGWDDQGFGVEMDGPGMSDSCGYGGSNTIIPDTEFAIRSAHFRV